LPIREKPPKPTKSGAFLSPKKAAKWGKNGGILTGFPTGFLVDL
jgi:hypothetical protein